MNAKILVVEDESIVAKDIQRSLQKMDYDVPALASTGRSAIKKAGEFSPDLILMDIVLKGDMDGIEAANEIMSQYHIPVVYLTAFSDEEMLARAKITEPFGYLIKPFDEKELHTTIEMALYKNKMERRLRSNESLLSTTLTSIGEAVIVLDPEDKVTFINTEAENLTLWMKEDTIGKPLTDIISFINEFDNSPFELTLNTITMNHDASIFSGRSLSSKKGPTFPIDYSFSPILDGKRQLGTVLVFRDITEKRNTHQRLVQNEKLAAVGEMAAMIAHEVNAPLVNINAITENLMDEELDEQIKLDLNSIIDQVDMASGIIKDLLNYSRKRMMNKSDVDMNILIKEMVGSFPLPSMIGLQLSLEEDLPTIFADRTQMIEVLTNLFNNSIDSFKKKGEIRIETITDDNEISILFIDDGRGMNRDTKEKAFKPFFTTKPSGKGTGLGLPIINRIVKAHNGNLELQSKVGKGTRIKIMLPLR